MKIEDVSYWTSFDRYERGLRFGLPILGLATGLLSISLVPAVMLGLVIALLEPTYWALRNKWPAILHDRMDLPRAMLLSIFGVLVLHCCLGLFVFHTVGSLVLGWLFSGHGGLQPDGVLPHGIISCCGFLILRTMRATALQRMPGWMSTADSARNDMLVELQRVLDPRLLPTPTPTPTPTDRMRPN